MRYEFLKKFPTGSFEIMNVTKFSRISAYTTDAPPFYVENFRECKLEEFLRGKYF